MEHHLLEVPVLFDPQAGLLEDFRVGIMELNVGQQFGQGPLALTANGAACEHPADVAMPIGGHRCKRWQGNLCSRVGARTAAPVVVVVAIVSNS